MNGVAQRKDQQWAKTELVTPKEKRGRKGGVGNRQEGGRSMRARSSLFGEGMYVSDLRAGAKHACRSGDLFHPKICVMACASPVLRSGIRCKRMLAGFILTFTLLHLESEKRCTFIYPPYRDSVNSWRI